MNVRLSLILAAACFAVVRPLHALGEPAKLGFDGGGFLDEDFGRLQSQLEQAFNQTREFHPSASPLPLLRYEKLPLSAVAMVEDLDRGRQTVYFSWAADDEHPHPEPKGIFHYDPGLGDARAPLIVMFPITGDPDFFFSKAFCAKFVLNGFRCAYLERVLPQERDLPQDMEGLLALPGLPPYSTETAMRGLDALEQLGLLKPGDKVGAAGISLGAIDAALMALTDRRVQAAGLMLGGGDMPLILSKIHGAGVGAFDRLRKREMKKHGWTLEDFKAEVAKFSPVGDPLAYLSQIPRQRRLPAERFLMINIKGDAAIPNQASDELAQALTQSDGGAPSYEKLPVPVPAGQKHVGGAVFWMLHAEDRLVEHFTKYLMDASADSGR